MVIPSQIFSLHLLAKTWYHFSLVEMGKHCFLSDDSRKMEVIELTKLALRIVPRLLVSSEYHFADPDGDSAWDLQIMGKELAGDISPIALLCFGTTMLQ